MHVEDRSHREQQNPLWEQGAVLGPYIALRDALGSGFPPSANHALQGGAQH